MSRSDPAATLDLSYRYILAIAVPVLIANLAMPLQSSIDVAIVGHFSQATDLAGLGVASQLWLLILVSFNFLQYASSGLSSQALGRQKAAGQHSAELAHILYRSLGLAVVLGGALWMLKPYITRLGLDLLGAQPNSRITAYNYISTRYFGIIFELMNYAFIGWFAGQGKTHQVMAVQLLISLTNILLTLLFVYILQLGLAGVALGTVLGYVLGCGIAAYLAYQNINQNSPYITTTIQKTVSYSSNKLSHIFAPDKMLSLFSLNKDIFIRTVLLTLSFAWITRLSAQQGELIMATNAILLQVLSISAFVLDGVAVAAESLSGQAAAHKKRDLLLLAIQRTGVVTLCLAISLSLIWLTTLPTFLTLMTDLPAVYQLVLEYRHIAALLPLIGAGAYWLDGIMFGLTAGTKIRQVAILSSLMFFPTTWLLYSQYGTSHAMWVIWFCVYLLLILRFAIAGIMMWRGYDALIKQA